MMVALERYEFVDVESNCQCWRLTIIITSTSCTCYAASVITSPNDYITAVLGWCTQILSSYI